VEVSISSKELIGVVLRGSLFAMSFVLTACGVFDSNRRALDASSEVIKRETPVRSSAARLASSELLDIQTVNNDAQDVLISEVNRDGEPLSFLPYDNSVLVLDELVASEDVVEFNYEQADLRIVLEQLAEVLSISLVIDPSIDDKVSVRTSPSQPLTQADIWPLIGLLTRDAGVVVEQVGNFYNVRKAPNSLPRSIISPEDLGDSSSSEVMQITPLTFVSIESAIGVIEPLLDSGGSIRRLLSPNMLAISGSEELLTRVNALLSIIDSDPFLNQGLFLRRLDNASAVEVATELNEILQLVEGGSPTYQVKGIERINAILVTAPASRGFQEINRWVQILDAASQEQVEQLFYYPVKNLSAVELGETLSDIFETENGRDSLSSPEGLGERAFIDRSSDQDQEGIATSRRGTTGVENAAAAANLKVSIVADEATNSLLIKSTVRDYRQLLTTINQLDAVPLQVMINAVIAQITLTDSNRFGVDWTRVASNSAVQPISTETSTGYVPSSLGGLMFSKSFIDGAAQVDATLQAISVNNEVELLARPSLTVINNQEGEIQIGSQVPVQQGQSLGTAGVSTTNIQYRDTGIVLSITPQINSDGIVNLAIRQELSSVESGAEGVNNNPIFNNQEINTTVVVRDGENVVLGGLIQTDVESLNTGVPVLNRVPLVGNLFSYRQQATQRRELFIVLRPEIVNLNSQSSGRYSDILQRFELASRLLEEY
jgi:general secretion pathway protein D